MCEPNILADVTINESIFHPRKNKYLIPDHNLLKIECTNAELICFKQKAKINPHLKKNSYSLSWEW